MLTSVALGMTSAVVPTLAWSTVPPPVIKMVPTKSLVVLNKVVLEPPMNVSVPALPVILPSNAKRSLKTSPLKIVGRFNVMVPRYVAAFAPLPVLVAPMTTSPLPEADTVTLFEMSARFDNMMAASSAEVPIRMVEEPNAVLDPALRVPCKISVAPV